MVDDVPWNEFFSAAEQRWREEEEAQVRAESEPPKYIIHTVHGTWARQADWIEADSSMNRRVRELLGHRARIQPFRWNGNNSVAARWEAAHELRKTVARSRQEFPTAEQVIVAHSHGGNIALWAFSQRSDAAQVLTVIALSTPFLTARRRPHTSLMDVGTGLFAGFFVVWAMLFFFVYRGYGLSTWKWAIGAGAAMFALMLLGTYVIERMQHYADRLCSQMPETALTREQLAIVRVQGDEASAAITGVRLAGILSDLLWSALSSPPYKRLRGALERLDYAGIRSATERRLHDIDTRYALQLKALGWHPPVQMELAFEEREPFAWQQTLQDPFERRALVDARARAAAEEFSWIRTIREEVPFILSCLVLYLVQQGSARERAIALACGLLWAAPAALCFATVLLGVPFAILTSITLLPCGWTLPLAGSYLQLTAECCPPGSWDVTLLKAGERPRGLFHSAVYQHYETAEFIVKCIRARAK